MKQPMTDTERAYNTLLQAILDDQLPRDEFLSQRKLAGITETSVISVREALRSLEHEGFVESIPKQGVRIPVSTKEQLTEVYRVREALEVMVAYTLCLHATPSQKEELYRLAEECDTISVEDPDSVEYFAEKHRELHLAMAETTGNPQLTGNLKRLGLRIILLRSAKTTWYKKVDDWAFWHRNLMDEIFSGDPVRAQEAMHRHIQHGLRNDLESYENGGSDDGA